MVFANASTWRIKIYSWIYIILHVICQGIFLPGKWIELHELTNLFNKRVINAAGSRRQVLVNIVSATWDVEKPDLQCLAEKEEEEGESVSNLNMDGFN